MKTWKQSHFFNVVAILAIFFTLTACGRNDGTSTGGGTDPALNGTWILDNYKVEDREETTCTNGVFQTSSDNFPSRTRKGTYTTNGDEITIQVTHVGTNGSLNLVIGQLYTKDEKMAAYEACIRDVGIPEEKIPEWVQEYDSEISENYYESKYTYTVVGDTLTFRSTILPSVKWTYSKL